MNKRGVLIFYVVLLVLCICACTNTPVENKMDTKKAEINDEKQKAEKENEKLKIEPISEEQEKQQKKEKLAELNAQLEVAESEFEKLLQSDQPVGRVVGDEIVYDEKEEKNESQIKEDVIKRKGYFRLTEDILRQIYSLLDLSYDEKYIMDYKNTWDKQIDGNRALNAAELAIYYPKIKVPWQIGDFHFVQAMIGSSGIETNFKSDEPCNTILKRDMTIQPEDVVELLYMKGERAISLNIINTKNISTLCEYIDELKVDLIRKDSIYTDYLTEPWKPDYKEYKLYKYFNQIDNN